MTTRPDWANLIEDGSDWQWVEGRLFHREAVIQPYELPRMGTLKRLLLDHLYAAHNASRAVRKTLVRLTANLNSGEWGANVGAGRTRLHPRLINVDLYASSEIDIITRGQTLPFRSGSLALVVSQEVLEHIEDPQSTISEIARVLRPGGTFYCQVPFIIGNHHGPHDYWRFTREGVQQLFPCDAWEITEISTSVGHGTGFYRIAVEFFAVTMSALHQRLYLPVKGLMAILLFPVKAADILTPRVSEKDRIPGGYYCAAMKRAGSKQQ